MNDNNGFNQINNTNMVSENTATKIPIPDPVSQAEEPVAAPVQPTNIVKPTPISPITPTPIENPVAAPVVDEPVVAPVQETPVVESTPVVEQPVQPTSFNEPVVQPATPVQEQPMPTVSFNEPAVQPQMETPVQTPIEQPVVTQPTDAPQAELSSVEPTKKKKMNPLILVLIFIVLLAGGSAAYYFISIEQAKKSTPKVTTTTTTTKKVEVVDISEIGSVPETLQEYTLEEGYVEGSSVTITLDEKNLEFKEYYKEYTQEVANPEAPEGTPAEQVTYYDTAIVLNNKLVQKSTGETTRQTLDTLITQNGKKVKGLDKKEYYLYYNVVDGTGTQYWTINFINSNGELIYTINDKGSFTSVNYQVKEDSIAYEFGSLLKGTIKDNKVTFVKEA